MASIDLFPAMHLLWQTEFESFNLNIKLQGMYPIFYAGSVGSRHGWRPLPTSVKMQFISFVAGFAFISREYISEYLPMAAPVMLKKRYF